MLREQEYSWREFNVTLSEQTKEYIRPKKCAHVVDKIYWIITGIYTERVSDC